MAEILYHNSLKLVCLTLNYFLPTSFIIFYKAVFQPPSKSEIRQQMHDENILLFLLPYEDLIWSFVFSDVFQAFSTE